MAEKHHDPRQMAKEHNEFRPYTAEEQSNPRRSTRTNLVRLLERTLAVQERNQERLKQLVEDSMAAKKLRNTQIVL